MTAPLTKGEFVAGSRPDDAAGRFDGRGNVAGRLRFGSLRQQAGHEVRDARPLGWFLHGAGTNEKTEAYRRLLVVQHDQHLQAVRQRLDFVRWKVHRPRRQRSGRTAPGPLLCVGGADRKGARQQRGYDQTPSFDGPVQQAHRCLPSRGSSKRGPGGRPPPDAAPFGMMVSSILDSGVK